MSAGFHSVNAVLWVPEAAPPRRGGFRSINALLWLPDGQPPLAPAPAELAGPADASRDYEKLPYQPGDWAKHIPRDRFGWSRGGGSTPPRH